MKTGSPTLVRWGIVILFVMALSVPRCCLALGQGQCLTEVSSAGSFPIVQGGVAATILVDAGDHAGVVRVVNDLQTDVGRVTGVSPVIVHNVKEGGRQVIIVGTIGKSVVIDGLIGEGKLDVSQIDGKWESYFIQVVPAPWPGVKNALVIVGSDQRGTIYGVYDLSEEMGVSPWHFWEDVPAQHHDELFVKAGKYVQGPPAVKYRGIFLNDEAPDLTGWANEKFGGYNHGFYTNVFELLLRLKANYLWPAMWNNCFYEDDPQNAELASEYGIVMGTSHVEPMMRADKEWNRAGRTAAEWNFDRSPDLLTAFWRAGVERSRNYENIVTVAMRGKIDSPMSEGANIALLEKIVAAQRGIIADVYQTNAAAVPQLWALYKEVQEYYEKGMRVPDDVTLLWCDDNWGNLRKLPTSAERGRSGGAGIYYHFDYVGGPRNYKWVDSSPLPRVWEQMNLAHEYGADRIWIVNVGHLQHVALPTEFFLDLAWNPDRWPKEKISEFTRLWAAREFGAMYADQIAEIVSRFGQFNGRRKPELLGPETFSLVNYQEADKVLVAWQRLEAEATDISDKLPADRRDAFFELVLYPVKACAQVNELHIAAAKNRLYAAQGRASANDYAEQVRALFKADADLSAYYNNVLAGGKWSHMMDQTHIGYSGWQQPVSNCMPEVVETEVPQVAEMGVAAEGSTNVWPGASGSPVLPDFDKFNRPVRYVDIFNRGRTPFAFTATTSAPWILLDQTDGVVQAEQRLGVSIDWRHAPAEETAGVITINDGGTNSVEVRLEVFNPAVPAEKSFQGFVEADGYVSMEAEHFTRKTDTAAAHWDNVPGLGRTLSAMTIFPVTAPSVMPPQASPGLEYKMYLFHAGTVEVDSMLSPSLNFMPGHGLRFAISFDDQPPQVQTAVPENYSVGAGDGNGDWERAVKDSVRLVKTVFIIKNPGLHTLKFWMVDPGVVLQKLVVNLGGVRPSYLGPPESFREN